MLVSLTLTNFRQHRRLHIQFSDGVTALVGRNESGKTSILEALSYAWFGAAYLSEPVADVVTWGQRASDMRVELVMRVGSTTYTTSRGPSGAETRFGVDSVVGQDAVTAHMADLLGVKPKVASKMLLAAQNELRGALSSGPTKAVELIDRIADLSIVDDLARVVAQRNPSGATAGVEAQIQAARAEAADLQALTPTAEAVDVAAQAEAAAAAQVTAATDALGEAGARRDAAQAEAAAAGRAVARAEQLESERARLEQQIRVTGREVEICEQALAQASRARPWPEMANHEVEQALEQRRVAAAGRSAVLTLHAQVQRWNEQFASLPALVFLEGVSDLAGWYAAASARRQELTQEIRRNDSALAAAKAQLITAENCNLCGRNLSTVAEVVETNNRLQTVIDTATALAPQLSAESVNLGARLREVELFDTSWSTLAKSLLCSNEHVVQVPGRFGTFSLLCRLQVPDEDLGLKADVTAWQNYKNQLTQLENHTSAKQSQLQQVKQQLEALPAAGLEAARAAEDSARQVLRDSQNALTPLETEKMAKTAAWMRLRDEARELQSRRQTGLVAIERLNQRDETLSAQVVKMGHTNELLSVLKGAKQHLANKVWDSVLRAVSSYLTSVRGVESVVTREDNRFKVNNKPAESLSGSAKDALGLSIRLALMQVFVPGTRLIVLDEPGQGCDDLREPAMLALARKAGFAQVVLVTHNRDVQGLADSVIEL